jgi:hypothetical protein
VFGNVGTEYQFVAVSGLGLPEIGYSQLESLDECKENIRICSGVGSRALQDRVIQFNHFLF